MIKSGAGLTLSKSSRLRTSPCTNVTPAPRRRGRFSSEPLRCRLSNTVTDAAGKFFLRAIDKLAPAKPAPPVMRIASAIYCAGPLRLRLSRLAMIVTPGKMLFKP